MSNDTWTLILLLAAVFGALAAIAAFSSRGSLDSIKSKTVVICKGVLHSETGISDCTYIEVVSLFVVLYLQHISIVHLKYRHTFGCHLNELLSYHILGYFLYIL